jgi:hypothetical protein
MKDIIVIASIGEADKWVEVKNFGRTKQRWLQQVLALPDATRSHDTFGRGKTRLKPASSTWHRRSLHAQKVSLLTVGIVVENSFYFAPI